MMIAGDGFVACALPGGAALIVTGEPRTCPTCRTQRTFFINRNGRTACQECDRKMKQIGDTWRSMEGRNAGV